MKKFNPILCRLAAAVAIVLLGPPVVVLYLVLAFIQFIFLLLMLIPYWIITGNDVGESKFNLLNI